MKLILLTEQNYFENQLYCDPWNFICCLLGITTDKNLKSSLENLCHQANFKLHTLHRNAKDLPKAWICNSLSVVSLITLQSFVCFAMKEKRK